MVTRLGYVPKSITKSCLKNKKGYICDWFRMLNIAVPACSACIPSCSRGSGWRITLAQELEASYAM